jgi:hypothetical protein
MSAPEILTIQNLRIYVQPANAQNLPVLERVFLEILEPSESPIPVQTHWIGSRPKHPKRARGIKLNGTLMAFPCDATPCTVVLANILKSGGYVATYKARSFDPASLTISLFTLMSTYEVRYFQSEQRDKIEITIRWVPIIPMNSEKIGIFPTIPWRDTYPDPNPPQ